MRGTGAAIGSFDPGANYPVTLLLGPFTYSVHQITLRSGLNIYGAGIMTNQTILQSDNTTVDMFVLGGTTAIAGVQFNGFRVYCGSGNSSQIAFHIVAQTNGGGLEYSSFNNLDVGFTSALSCGGGSFLFDGNAAGSPPGINQFLQFNVVQAFRTTGGSPAFKATGLNGQFNFNMVQFDSQTPDTAGGINFQIDDGTQTFSAPYTFSVTNGTFQQAQGNNGAAIRLKGVSGFNCFTCHFENDNGAVWATIGTTYGSWGVNIDGGQLRDNTGIDSSNGFILKTDANSSIKFTHNTVYGTPDTMFAGTTTYVSSTPNINDSSGAPQPAPANNRPVVGFDSDSPALKHVRVTTGAIGGGTRINTTVTWTTPFADANYSVVCNVLDTTTASTSAGLVLERMNATQTAANAHFTTFNPTGGTITGTLECIAIHD